MAIIKSTFYTTSEMGEWIIAPNDIFVNKDCPEMDERMLRDYISADLHAVKFSNGDIYDLKLHSWRHLYKPQPIPDTSNIKDILSERGSRYGDFAGHALLTQALKDTFADHSVSYSKLTPPMVEAIEMIFHKLGRIGNGNPFYADSWVDIVGYAQLVVDILKGEGENK